MKRHCGSAGKSAPGIESSQTHTHYCIVKPMHSSPLLLKGMKSKMGWLFTLLILVSTLKECPIYDEEGVMVKRESSTWMKHSHTTILGIINCVATWLSSFGFG